MTSVCDQASQVTLSTLAQHQRELLHTLELETLRARAGSEAGLPIDVAAASDQSAAGGSRDIGAAPPAGATYMSAVATFSQDPASLKKEEGLGVQGRDLVGAEAAGRQRQRAEAAIGQATLEQKMEGLRLTMQRYATVGQELLGLQVEVARQQTLDAQNRARIEELERINSATNASLQSALVLNEERVEEFKTEILQHQRLAAALEIQLEAVKKEGEEALGFVHAECQRLRKALADAVEREQARYSAEGSERQEQKKEAAALAANYQAALKRIAKLDLEVQIAVMEAQAERNATQGLRDEVEVCERFVFFQQGPRGECIAMIYYFRAVNSLCGADAYISCVLFTRLPGCTSTRLVRSRSRFLLSCRGSACLRAISQCSRPTSNPGRWPTSRKSGRRTSARLRCRSISTISKPRQPCRKRASER